MSWCLKTATGMVLARLLPMGNSGELASFSPRVTSTEPCIAARKSSCAKRAAANTRATQARASSAKLASTVALLIGGARRVQKGNGRESSLGKQSAWRREPPAQRVIQQNGPRMHLRRSWRLQQHQRQRPPQRRQLHRLQHVCRVSSWLCYRRFAGAAAQARSALSTMHTSANFAAQVALRLQSRPRARTVPWVNTWDLSNITPVQMALAGHVHLGRSQMLWRKQAVTTVRLASTRTLLCMCSVRHAQLERGRRAGRARQRV
jgi:hypothetical protein